MFNIIKSSNKPFYNMNLSNTIILQIIWIYFINKKVIYKLYYFFNQFSSIITIYLTSFLKFRIKAWILQKIEKS